ncbi:AN1-type zinc finger protein 4 [Megalops cyprinoides]|uniref:AN1-type zinc finger protein 4 n=1 Tax=Megalops cyprinoides TaxID=118141 RepID=UPI0018655BA9|nr:AN1-type zinc finger protein 4 [Megalops cyprinoides]
MADKKNPPFFNEDNTGPFHFKPTFFETMELLIETLTGTCFELCVSPFETVVSVKAKIQRLEGIPVAQQHLIWNNMELEDEYCLHDYNIAEGCTLKLVLAMRGGPINTRRVPMDDPVKEATEYMEAGREEAWEKSQHSKQVTYLVYREGDQLNFFRVVDRGDGTLTPVSESISGGSVYNLYAEEEDEEEGDGAALGQQALENSITMSKMKLLKAKMESMNLNKKPKKTAKLKPRPPGGARPCSSNLAPSRHHQPFRVLPQIGQPLAPTVQLPAVRDQQPNKVGPGHLALSPLPFPAPAPTSQDLIQEEEEPWECPTLSKIRPPPKVSRLEVGGPKLLKDHLLPPLSVLSSRGVPDGSMEEAEPKVGGVALIEESTLADPHTALPFSDTGADPLSLNLPGQEMGGRGALGAVAEQLPAAPLLSQVISSDSVDAWPVGARRVCRKPARAQLGSFCASPNPPLAPGSPQRLPPPFEFAATSLWPTCSRAFLKAEDCPTLTAARIQGVRMESPSRRPELLSKQEARSITSTAGKVAKDPLGSFSNTGLLASLSRTRTREGGPGPGSHVGLGRLCSAGVPLSTNIHLFQEDLLRKAVPVLGPPNSYTSANGSNGGPSSSIRRMGTPTYLLPLVKTPVFPKKKSSKHCFLCGKKTGLATSFECRCGNNFCASHRYAETHACSYDYKGAGRRFLQETNPIITAPKLPKI